MLDFGAVNMGRGVKARSLFNMIGLVMIGQICLRLRYSRLKGGVLNELGQGVEIVFFEVRILWRVTRLGKV